MSRLSLSIAMAASFLNTSAMAQEEGKIPEPRPLLARYVADDGQLLIGGGPEAALIASALAGPMTIRISGPSGAIPLLTQGVILLAVLPRDMTQIERTAVRRFAGGAPFTVQIMQGLYVHIRRDKSGAIDAQALPLLSAMLADEGQTRLAGRLPAYKGLAASDLATARTQVTALASAHYAKSQPGYTQPDGRLSIIGSDTLTEIMPDILKAYATHSPDVRFSADLRGSSTAMPALTAGTTIFAPMGRELWQNDLDAFRQAKGYVPTRIRIAYASHGPRQNGKTPPAIYVNANNPIAGLSVAEMKRIFAAAAPGGDIADWSRLTSQTALRGPIHVYGARDDGGFGTAMRLSKLDSLPFSARYQPMPSGTAILDAIAADPLGIGYATWIDAGKAPAGVRIVPLALQDDGGPYVLPNESATRGDWPISYFFNIYVDKQPGKALDSRVKGLIRFLLSEEGQQIIAKHSDDEDGYVPLNLQDIAAERQILDRL